MLSDDLFASDRIEIRSERIFFSPRWKSMNIPYIIVHYVIQYDKTRGVSSHDLPLYVTEIRITSASRHCPYGLRKTKRVGWTSHDQFILKIIYVQTYKTVMLHNITFTVSYSTCVTNKLKYNSTVSSVEPVAVATARGRRRKRLVWRHTRTAIHYHL